MGGGTGASIGYGLVPTQVLFIISYCFLIVLPFFRFCSLFLRPLLIFSCVFARVFGGFLML